MLRSETIPHVAFGEEGDGDGRTDPQARSAISAALGIPTTWATIHQVHGNTVAVASAPGDQGEADALITTAAWLPIAIGTADCVPVAVAGRSSIGLAHAGWRGVAAGVVPALLERMRDAGDEPLSAVIGPHIGSCCYAVGPEVVDAVGGYEMVTRDGARSVDLAAAIVDQLRGVPVERVEGCTMDEARFASYRRNGTTLRQVTVAWRTAG